MKGLLQIFYSPDKAFEEINVRKAAWVIPLIALVIVQTAASMMLIRTVGLERIVRLQLEANPKTVEQLGQDGVNKAAQRAAESTLTKTLTYALPPLGPLVMMPIVSGIFLGILLIMGATAKFSKVLAASCYAWFVYAFVVGIALTLVLLLKKDYDDLDLRNLVGLNPAMFLDKTSTSKALYSLVGSFDVFSFLLIFYVAYGLSKVSEKTTFAKCLTAVIIPWVVYVLAKAGLSTLF